MVTPDRPPVLNKSGICHTAGGMALRYEERRPPARLAPVVERVWRLRHDDVGAAAPHRVLPDGRIELIVHLGSRVVERRPGGPERLQPRIHVTGQLERFLLLEPLGDIETLGVRFRPCAAVAVLGIADGELTGRTLGVGQIMGDAGRHELEAAAAASDPLTALAEVCSRRLDPRRQPDPRLARAVAILGRGGGRARVSRLCRHLGLHPRTLQRQMARDFGLRPKRMARIARMEATLRALSLADESSLAALAHDRGFADQAHLSRELRYLTGLSPTEWRHGSHPFARQFLRRRRPR